MFEKILVANRGEIAVRIIRTCRDQGITSVAVYSEADRDAPHARLADDRCYIGASEARHSYLAIDRIVEAALQSGAEAIHPGYGLLSENAAFVEAVNDAGLVFIGPSAAVIARMGDKISARRSAAENGVPVLDGTATFANSTEAQAAARELGFPLIVKAAFGGGGRGIRVVRDESELSEALASASREAKSAFGHGAVYLERYLERSRHVEIQILGDRHGSTVHLGDRDCSVQRRHQKIVEEAPAPGLPDELRDAMRTAAVRLASGVGYDGAGTVEFLVPVGAEGFYFLELNTRRQVEHGVTELVTGIDIVAQQIRLAAGEPLSVKQSDIAIRGHAIQLRVAAEDPTAGFRPSTGRIGSIRLPSGPWVRCDFGVETGQDITPHYDSMIGKIQAWGPTRNMASERLLRAIAEFEISGVRTNAALLTDILRSSDFAGIAHHVHWLEAEFQLSIPVKPDGRDISVAREKPQGYRRRILHTLYGTVELETFVTAIAPATGQIAAERRHEARSGAPSADTQAISSRSSSLAPIDATVIDVRVAPGDRVERDAVIVTLEAMKMELPVRSDRDGVIKAVNVTAGMSVRAGTVLVVFEQTAREP